MAAPNAPDGFGTRKGDHEYFEDPDLLVAGDDAEILDDGADTEDLERAITALELVRWSEVETVSASTAVQFCEQLREARDQRRADR